MRYLCWAVLVSGLGFLGAAAGIAVYVYSDQVLLDFDPSDLYSVTIVWFNVYETLLRYYPEEDHFEGVLATSYERTNDGLIWTFYLRPGVKFHTGNYLTAHAVKFCIERTMARGKGMSYIWEPIDHIEVVDDLTVRFYLKYPAPLDIISSSLAGAYIFDPAFSDHDWFEAGNDSGTGPYRFIAHRGLDEAVIERFDDYWRGWTGREFDRVIFKYVPEDVTRKMLLETGQADYTNRLAPELLQAVSTNPALEIVVGPTWEGSQYYLNTLKPPLDNVLVRKALAYALPYEDIVEGAYFGYARGATGYVPYTLWGWSDNTRMYEHNLTVAREFLTLAGYPNGGFKLVLLYQLGDEFERRSAELFKRSLANLGIELELRAMPWDARFGIAHIPDPTQRQDIFLMYSWPLTPSPVPLLKDMIGTHEPPILNLSYYSNPVVDALLERAGLLSATDREAASLLIREINNMVLEDVPVIPVVDMQRAAVKQASLVGPAWAFNNPAYPRVVDWYHVYRK
ncbi:MAG: ABC transporter substrate-binding protein [Candidatus Methanomethyliaceae archaeon]